jgi:hypothetical protein
MKEKKPLKFLRIKTKSCNTAVYILDSHHKKMGSYTSMNFGQIVI